MVPAASQSTVIVFFRELPTNQNTVTLAGTHHLVQYLSSKLDQWTQNMRPRVLSANLVGHFPCACLDAHFFHSIPASRTNSGSLSSCSVSQGISPLAGYGPGYGLWLTIEIVVPCPVKGWNEASKREGIGHPLNKRLSSIFRHQILQFFIKFFLHSTHMASITQLVRCQDNNI